MTNAQYKRFRQARNEIVNVIDNTIRFCWDHETMCYGLRCCLKDLAIPNYAVEYLLGYSDALIDLIWHQYVEFSYDIPSTGRVFITSDEYQRIPPIVISRYWSHTGAFAWRANVNKLFSKTKEQQRAPIFSVQRV